MKLNLNTELKTIQGAPIVDETQKQMTAGGVMFSSLVASGHQDDKLDGSAKFKRYELAKTVYVGGEMNISTEEVILIKKVVGMYMPIQVVGAIYNFIEGNNQ